MEYLYIYSAASEFIEDYYGEEYHEPWVSLTLETEEINYNKKGRDRLLITPLTFKVISGGNLSIQTTKSHSRDFEYSLNGGEWTEFSVPGVSGELLITTLAPGDEISFRRDNDNFSNTCFIGDSNLKLDIYGNIMSMQYGSGFPGQTEIRNLKKTEIFEHLFDGMGVVDASELLLPAMTLSRNCYRYMFYGCTDLLYAPELPATGLANGCYSYMFYNCNNLRETPELPATTLADNCYKDMFNRCGSLTEIPELPATTLAESCYHNMFQYCTGLTSVPADALPATTLAKSCYYSMFQNCTNLTTAPELLVAKIPYFGYRYMFNGCQSLSYIKCLATDLSEGYCTTEWVSNVSSAGTFIKDASMNDWPRNGHGIPATWEVFDNELSIIDTPRFFNNALVKTIRIYSDVDWSVTSCPNWLSVDITSGESGLYTISMTAQTNNTGNKRTGNFTVQSNDGLQTKTVELVQYASPENSYLTFIIESNGNLYWKADDTIFTRTIEYNKNGEGWSAITSNTNNSAPAIPVSKGDIVEFRGDNATYTNDDNKSNKISASTDCNIYGNIMSMIDSTGFTSLAAFDQTKTRTFRNFFEAVPVIDASNLIIPSTALTLGCYMNMFRGCKKLLYTPELPATTLAEHCYSNMFSGCTSLTTAPELLATTLAPYCYYHMFRKCTALTTIQSALPATTLAESCYNSMFFDCTSLTTAPELPAITLAARCYKNMFNGCSSLNYVKALFTTDPSSDDYTTDWLNGVSQTGTFVKNASASWTTTGPDGVPTGWTVITA